MQELTCVPPQTGLLDPQGFRQPNSRAYASTTTEGLKALVFSDILRFEVMIFAHAAWHVTPNLCILLKTCG